MKTRHFKPIFKFHYVEGKLQVYIYIYIYIYIYTYLSQYLYINYQSLYDIEIVKTLMS